ncbi:MAG: N-acetylneuraminate synthase family protein [Candidatus Omnitrophica bacterium]|nr:N-acetylneuraminate synthase family protein [Candidatus Omnitrophota bacterium]MDD5736835.1 N-acetylneuraminate synthase family protein [Candidatus Omnitrophota bacterium]
MKKSVFDDLVIFEMANNHQGSLKHGLKIIDEMDKAWKDAGCGDRLKKAIKFQYRDIDSFIHPQYRDYAGNKHIKRFQDTRLTEVEFKKLADHAKKRGFINIATPFDEASLRLIRENKIEIVKVASCSACDWPLLEEISKLKKPVICSIAGADIKDVDNIVSFFVHRNTNFALMHCIGIYPALKQGLHMNRIDLLRYRYPFVPIGYSGHEEPGNLDAAKIAVSKGIKILERHVGVPTNTIKLNAYSLTPPQVTSWLGAIMDAKQMCGGAYEPSNNEIASLGDLRRGVFAARDIKRGDKVLRKDVFFCMPYFKGKMHSGEFKAGYTAGRAYKKFVALDPVEQKGVSHIVYTAIHEAKALLYEARIFLKGDFSVEISHHYGIERFRDYGALIITVLNREYCKKLLVMVAGQKHPSHFHKQKEESFHILHGDLVLVMGGVKKHLGSGDIITLKKGEWHSFTTKGGVVFEEVSTTHYKDDSFYDDERICSESHMRKTPIQRW